LKKPDRPLSFNKETLCTPNFFFTYNARKRKGVDLSVDNELIEVDSSGDNELIPPIELRNLVGGGDFKEIGEQLLHEIIDLGRLKPNDHVLDIGCGVGRVAIPLTKYLSKIGSYEGFDITPASINWCQKNITPKYPNFNFQLIDIYNKAYNPTGKYRASQLKFPYKDNSFDFIILISVFTNMLPEDIENYMSEIARVLKNNGRCFITLFLLNPESLYMINNGFSSLEFPYEFAGYRAEHQNLPEAAVAYNEQLIRELIEKYQLKIDGPIYYGSWCDRDITSRYQDVIILKRG
jgi:ubiquinone/menaquinone biosynthesis C-methylase UbiE